MEIRWGIGYEAAYNLSMTSIASMEGDEACDEAAKMRIISGFPTRQITSDMLDNAENLGRSYCLFSTASHSVESGNLH